MELKNISSFKDFRKINEAGGGALDQFNNQTGFAQSLVGRGFFSIIRFFKKGVNLGRLEYLKRKLENEYFAGWLRFCALNKVNLKDGTMPPKEEDDKGQGEEGGQEGGQNIESNEDACEIFNIDWIQNNYIQTSKDQLIQYNADLEQQMATLEEGDENIAKIEELIKYNEKLISFCDIKMKINLIFNSLVMNDQYGVDRLQEGMTFTPEQATPIKEHLVNIATFLSGEAKICPNYHLTEDERKIINKINTCTNDDVKAECAKILALLEKVNYGIYDMINEEFVSSSINTAVPIMQILGDSLNVMPDGTPGAASNKVQPYDYLKNIGINNVDEINFKACADLWAQHPDFKEKTTSLVSLDGVRKIQYAAARIIYKHKMGVTGHGEMSPGLDYQEDSDLRTAWERKVEKCKGEWRYFMNVDYDIDPFKQMSLQDAFRKKDGEYENFSKGISASTKPAEDAAQLDGLGFKMLSGVPSTQGEIYILQYMYGNPQQTAYLAFYLMSPKDNRSFYLYLGNIDVDKLKADKIKEKTEAEKKSSVGRYTASILSPDYLTKGDVNFNNYFRINSGNLIVNGKNINSIILASVRFFKISSSDPTSAANKNTKLFYLYTNEQQGTRFGEARGTATKDNTSIKVFDGNSRNMIDATVPGLKSQNAEITSKLGFIWKFESNEWAESYFPNKNDLRRYWDKNKDYLNDRIFIDANM